MVYNRGVLNSNFRIQNSTEPVLDGNNDMYRILPLLLLILVSSSIALGQTATAANDPNSFFKPVKWRSIGPFRGGRSVSSTGVPGNDKIYYMGTTGGGVWKTVDAGITWRNVSDGFMKTGSVGAIAVAESVTESVRI